MILLLTVEWRRKNAPSKSEAGLLVAMGCVIIPKQEFWLAKDISSRFSSSITGITH